MEEDGNREQYKHVCRLCNKRFPSGKSLGGHMRSHVIAEARKNKLIASLNNCKNVSEFIDDDKDEDEDEDDMEIVDRNGNVRVNSSKYGLRENPKKTWRIVDSNYPGKVQHNDHHQERESYLCKQCGKGFHSLKALCGHMSIHSDKDKHSKEDDQDDDTSWSSDSIDQLFLAIENNNNNINISDNTSKPQTRSSLYKSIATTTTNDSITSNNNNSSSIHSEIDMLEQEEVAMCLMMLSRDYTSYGGKNTWFTLNGAVESSDNNLEILEGKNNKIDQEIDNSDSGYFENGAKELESVDSIDVKKKRKIYDYNYDYTSISNSNSNSNRGKYYECWICNKMFKTHQALGGHIISHRKNGENNLYNNAGSSNSNLGKGKNKGSSTSKKVKGHKCIYCPKVFKSGQALGGHKRSHMMGSNSNNNVVFSRSSSRLVESCEIKAPLIDLNLPAPLEEDVVSSDDSHYVSWGA